MWVTYLQLNEKLKVGKLGNSMNVGNWELDVIFQIKLQVHAGITMDLYTVCIAFTAYVMFNSKPQQPQEMLALYNSPTKYYICRPNFCDHPLSRFVEVWVVKHYTDM